MKFKVQVTECVDYHYDVTVDAPDMYQAAIKAEEMVEVGSVLPIDDEVTGVFATNAKEIKDGEENKEVGQQPVQEEVSRENQ